MVSRLIRIYTPFICAIAAIIHGVLFLVGYTGVMRNVLGEFTGHSIFLILYIISASHKMCKWYKITNYLLLSIHFVNLAYYTDIISDSMIVIYSTLLLNILAVGAFLIYRVSVGITKVLC